MSVFRVIEDLGNIGFERQLAEQKPAAVRGVRQGLYFLGRELYKTVRAGIKDGPKTGQTYVVRKGKSGRRYTVQASAPGEYPANQTGTLRKSIGFEVVGSRQLTIGATAPYALYLEKGTRHMEPRPMLEKAVIANQENAAKILPREMQRAVLYEGR